MTRLPASTCSTPVVLQSSNLLLNMGSLFVTSPSTSTTFSRHAADTHSSSAMAPSIESSLDTQGLATEQRGLLDLIDKLQFAQLDNVKLPQIVVVGDQSAGKSSVLEALSGTPFPRAAGACTRFATEIRMRRAKETNLKVSIIPDKTRPYNDQARLLQYGGDVTGDMSFEAMMRDATELIAPRDVPGRFAARDILVVEKSGPDMPLLTLVDLPGLVRVANRDQSDADIQTIEALSDRYMKSSRTIILAVIGGNNDYVQAPILTKARQFDPKGSRTIGVLTKPDMTERIGLEDKFIELVMNKDKENNFKLGLVCPAEPRPGRGLADAPGARSTRGRLLHSRPMVRSAAADVGCCRAPPDAEHAAAEAHWQACQVSAPTDTAGARAVRDAAQGHGFGQGHH